MREKEIPGGIRLVGQVAGLCAKKAVLGTFQAKPTRRADSFAAETAAANVNPVLRSVQAFTQSFFFAPRFRSQRRLFLPRELFAPIPKCEGPGAPANDAAPAQWDTRRSRAEGANRG